MNTLNEIKNAEIIKNKKSTPRQKELLDLFSNLLGTILTDKTLKSESQKDENENEDDKNENENEEYDDDETMSQNKKIYHNKKQKWCFRWNNWQIKIIWKANKIIKKIKRSKRVLALQRLWS